MFETITYMLWAKLIADVARFAFWLVAGTTTADEGTGREDHPAWLAEFDARREARSAAFKADMDEFEADRLSYEAWAGRNAARDAEATADIAALQAGR